MADRPFTRALWHVRQALTAQNIEHFPDGRLLERFVAQHDEAAFEALVHRHGPLVHAVCRRLLPTTQDVEDAFQATFLVLVRRASSLDRRGSLSSWLYTVAYHLALKARAHAARRRAIEQPIASVPAEPASSENGNDVRLVLDEELDRLPEKYRAPVVLCYFQGKTNEEAARQLGWPVGTVWGRLARARELLRQRLGRRGMALTLAALETALTENGVTAAAPVSLAGSTVRRASLVSAGSEGVSGSVAPLVAGALKETLVARLKVAAAVVLLLAAAGLGVGLVTHQAVLALAAEAAEADVKSPEPAGSLRQESPVTFMAFSPDGKLLATEGDDWNIVLWDVAARRRSREVRVHKEEFFGQPYWFHLPLDRTPCAFSLDSRLLVARDYDVFRDRGQILPGPVLRFWNPSTGTPVPRTISGVGAFAFAPAGHTLAVAEVPEEGTKPTPRRPINRSIRLLETATGKERGQVKVMAGRIRTLAFSADGKALALADVDDTVQLWDLVGNKRLQQFQVKIGGPAPSPRDCLIFSPDGRHVTWGGSWDGTIRLWEVATAKGPRDLKLHAGLAHSVTFSTNGKRLAAAGKDNTVLVADVATGKLIHTVKAPSGGAGVTTLVLAPDGKAIATGATDGRIFFEPLP
jgi:RNA polymerase sigma factor (sigma-70 family)